MKKRIFFLSFVFLSFVATSQVIITMRAFYQGNLVNLDSIIVENRSRPGKRTWAAPPSINTYLIDLMQGTLINGIAAKNDAKGQISLISNEPGDTVQFTAFRNGMYRNSKT